MQRTPFIGTLAGVVTSPLGAILANAIAKAAQTALAGHDQSPNAVVVPPVERQVIAQEIARDVLQTPELQHIAGTETHWYQKRSVWSAIVSGVTPFLAIAGFNLSPEMGEYLAAGLGIAGGLIASYLAKRAGTATKPLGA